MHGLEGASQKLMGTEFHSLQIASGRDSQSLVLDHLKFVQVGRGHMGEPDEGVEV